MTAQQYLYKPHAEFRIATQDMKYINKLRKVWDRAIVVGFILATLEWVTHQVPALSELNSPTPPNADNLVCYMQTEEGQTLNLESLCGASSRDKQPIEYLSDNDRKFIEDYKKLLKGFPEAEAALSGVVDANPQIITKKAAQVCNELRTGVYSDSRINQPDVDADVINYLAPEYYCPEFKD